MLDALPFAQQPRAGDGFDVGADAALDGIAAIEVFAEFFQTPDGLGFQPAIGQLLDAVSEAGYQILPVEGRRLAGKQLAPLHLQFRRRGGLQRGQTRGDGVMGRHAFLR